MNRKSPCYPVLESEIAKNGVMKKDIAKRLGIIPRTLSNKLSGKCDFTLSEAVLIHEIFPDIPIEVLFRKRG